jgi:transcriptional regulator with XRE-family HTH domain
MAAAHKKRVGDRIRQAREAKGWTQRELANELPGKVDGPGISRWERGGVMPQSDTLEAIAAALDVDVAYFHVEDPTPGTPDLMGALRNGDQPNESQLDRIETKLDILLELAKQLLADDFQRASDAVQADQAQRGQGRRVA